MKTIKWLAADIDERHATAVGSRYPATGTWVLDTTEYKSWVQGKGPPCLWLNGIGKSQEPAR
jgi:hypothetical protein